MPPLHDIAHLAHVELRTPAPEQSLEFFVRYLGLKVFELDAAPKAGDPGQPAKYR
jgi:catechol 2,3-dioxygenase-like lactoylglutathione lyase family enzyme